MIASNHRNDVMHVSCHHCSKEYAILLNEKDFDEWQAGEAYIQEALDYLTASERELLISNTCNDCWKKMYGEDMDDE
tara:strand:+ start:604 stop:834 length:231 start_codon:yes stop_codon:yes gene_type:complete